MLPAELHDLLDLACSLRRTLSQRTHFLRNHGKATAGFAGTGGLHAGVQREDVGLEGDAVDHADEFSDLRAGLGDAVHALTHVLHALAGDFGLLTHL
jgi:hypothetical protein